MESQVPKDRSLRAYRVARQHGQGSDLSVAALRDLIMKVDIDEPTATEAAEAVVTERKDRGDSFHKHVGYCILTTLAALVAPISTGDAEYLVLILFALIFLLVVYPWGWKISR